MLMDGPFIRFRRFPDADLNRETIPYRLRRETIVGWYEVEVENPDTGEKKVVVGVQTVAPGMDGVDTVFADCTLDYFDVIMGEVR